MLYTHPPFLCFSLRFNDNGAYADKHYLLYKNNDLRLEVGKNRPAVALKRKTEGYPLMELHTEKEGSIMLMQVAKAQF